jgi:hypothetical protein
VAEFQWWLLLVGIVAGGGLVAVISMDGSRRDADILEEERRAEATWIAAWLASEGRSVSDSDAAAVLEAHREYLALPPPDRLEPVEPRVATASRPATAVPAAPAAPRAQAGSIPPLEPSASTPPVTRLPATAPASATPGSPGSPARSTPTGSD